MAAAHCRKANCKPRDLNEPERLRVFRRDLARTGQYIPGYRLLDEENLARKATLTSSGDLRLSALPPDGPLLHLEHSWAQLLPLPAARVPAITCLLDVSEATTLEVALRTGHRPDNFTPENTLATRRIELSSGLAQEVTIDFATDVAQATYAFVCFAANPAVRIRTSEERVTGLLAVRRRGDQKAPEGIGVDSFEQWSPLRRPAGQNLALKFSPALEGFGSENVINGLTRPTDAANAWVSAPNDGNAWLEFKWPSPQKIGRVEITFDADWDHPLESVFMDHPERVMPFTVREYRLLDGTGRVLHAAEKNHQARHVIAFEGGISTDCLRLEMPSRQGNAPAAVFEVRIEG